MRYIRQSLWPTRVGLGIGAGSLLVSQKPEFFRPRYVDCQEVALPKSIDISSLSSLSGLIQTPDWVSPDTVKPLTGGLTFGGVSGLAAGFACKKIGKALAVGVGSLYCLFQVAASYGYITVNWKKVEEDVMGALDTNNDGKVDDKDAAFMLSKVMTILSNDELEGSAAKNSATGAFAGSFLLGLKKG